MEIRAMIAELFHANGRMVGRMDGRTDRQTDMKKWIITFLNFVNAPKNHLQILR